jgi:alpha 1,6-mannosyltransferase
MLRMRLWRRLRILFYILILSGLVYLFLPDEIPTLPAFGPSQRKTKYATRPTYEYTSSYRKNANSTLEADLDAQLLGLERSVRSSLPPNERNLIADLTIHQISTDKLASQMSKWVNQWRTNNPNWEYNLITTHPVSVLSRYSSIPSILSAYEAYPSQNSDLIRYMLLWYYGGFYTDVRTWERVSLKDCPPIVEVTHGGKEMSLMIGVERDEPFYSQKTIEEMGWSRSFGFGMGTVWAVRRFDPVLRTAIVRTISHAEAKRDLDSREGWRDIFQLGLEEWEKSEISGTGMFTDIVLENLNDGLKDSHELRDRDAGLERRVTWKKFKGLRRALWIDQSQAKDGKDMRGIAVLPVNVWSNGQNHSGSGTYEAEEACINLARQAGVKKEWYERLFW